MYNLNALYMGHRDPMLDVKKIRIIYNLNALCVGYCDLMLEGEKERIMVYITMDTPQGKVRLYCLYNNGCQINLIN